jgi:phosphatidate cytidylyltransferase
MLPIFAVTVPGFLIGAFVMALSSRRAPPGVMSQRWLKLVVFFLIVHVVLGVAMLGRGWVTAVMAIVLTAGAFEMHRAWGAMAAPRPRALWPVFVAVAAIVLCVARGLPGATFAFLFLVTAASDGFSQVVGQLVGRHKLAPRISPAKTIEGLLGGLVAAIVVGLLVRPMLLHWGVLATLGLTLATALAGLAGDLAASWVKRRARIKDYSAALPGQGGFLDRFDSLLGAMTIVGLALVGPP